MDREKARERLANITDPLERQAETFRIEGDYYLEAYISSRYMQLKGKCIKPDALLRIFKAIETLAYDSSIAANQTPEEKARADYANQILDAEFR